MAYVIFSKRQKRMLGDIPDIPDELRFQVLYIWEKVWEEAYYNDFGELQLSQLAYDVYKKIESTLREEYGVGSLVEGNDSDGEIDDLYQIIYDFLFETKNTGKLIDLIEVSFRYIDQDIRDKFYVPNDDEIDKAFGISTSRRDISYEGIPPDEAIDLLNQRFREHGVGYQYESGQIVKVDSPDIDSEVDMSKSDFLSQHEFRPAISPKVESFFSQGTYDTAVFEAFKQVEIAVRKAGGYAENDIGTKLMRKAFNVKNGDLTDQNQQETEKEARFFLFAGAIGAYKNPGSHRDVEITAEEAIEMIALASLLLRIIDSRSWSEGDWREQFAKRFVRHLKNRESSLMDPEVFMGESAWDYPRYIGFNIGKIERLNIRNRDAFWLVASTVHPGKVYLKLHMNDSNCFNQLESQKAAIQREFGEQLKWERENKPHRIGVDLEVNPLDENRGQWNQHFEDMREKLEKLNEIFQSRIEALFFEDDIPF